DSAGFEPASRVPVSYSVVTSIIARTRTPAPTPFRAGGAARLTFTKQTGRSRFAHSTHAIGDARVLEGRHVVQQSHRLADDGQRERATGSLAEPQLEVEKRLQAELLQDRAMTKLARSMRRDHEAHRRGCHPRRDQGGGAGDEAVDDDGPA